MLVTLRPVSYTHLKPVKEQAKQSRKSAKPKLNKPNSVEPPKPADPILQPIEKSSAELASAKPAPIEVVPITEATTVAEPDLAKVEENSSKGMEEAVQPENTETAAEGDYLEINQNVYQYVASDYDVYTEKDSALNSSPVGKASMVYEQLPNSVEYHIKSLIKAKGLAALVVPDLLQISEGNIGNAGLQPKHYLYQFGNKKNKTYTADFDWEAKNLHLQSSTGSQTRTLTEGTQDLLSFMYQFMFVPPLQKMQLSITNGKKIGIYDYSFEGEELITTKVGDLKTVHLSRSSVEGEKKTELWLALDYQYVPVKIRETGKDGKVYELLVSSLKTSP